MVTTYETLKSLGDLTTLVRKGVVSSTLVVKKERYEHYLEVRKENKYDDAIRICAEKFNVCIRTIEYDIKRMGD